MNNENNLKFLEFPANIFIAEEEAKILVALKILSLSFINKKKALFLHFRSLSVFPYVHPGIIYMELVVWSYTTIGFEFRAYSFSQFKSILQMYFWEIG